MKRTITSIVVLLNALFATGVPQSSKEIQQGAESTQLRSQPKQEPMFIFRQIEATLRHDTDVPLRLPRFLPDVDEKHPIYPIIQSTTDSNYEVLLALVVPCEGQNNCLYGSVRGSASPIELDEGTKVPVKLRRGINAQFVPSVCHAFCNEAYIRWHENGFYYSIGIKAGKKKTLIEVANSAILSGEIAKRKSSK